MWTLIDLTSSSPCPPFAFRGKSFDKNEAEVCDVLCDALASMLKDREGSSSSHASCNGPVSDTPPASSPIAEAVEDRGTGDEGQGVLPEDRKGAVELLRVGEERVLRLCLEWVEVRRKACVGGG